MKRESKRERQYLRILLNAIEVCRQYQPRLGGREAVTVEQFLRQYGADPFYHWMGLDTAVVYRAHRAGGGITSLYRQIGIGCQRLFQQILMDQLGLSEDQVQWSYKEQQATGKSVSVQLDARVPLEDIPSPEARERFSQWIDYASQQLQDVDSSRLKGVVFEVRQGYKSRDSKRQKADVQSAARAYAAGYMPVMLLLSEQIDVAVAQRYISANWLLLKGNLENDSARSTDTFCSSVVGFDLAGFFERSSPQLREAIQRVLGVLLGDE